MGSIAKVILIVVSWLVAGGVIIAFILTKVLRSSDFVAIIFLLGFGTLIATGLILFHDKK